MFMNLMYKVNESRFWSNVHKDWNMYKINDNIYYKIVNFDNLDEKFKNCKNLWNCYCHNVNEIALVNVFDPNIYIGSIKIWKTKLYVLK